MSSEVSKHTIAQRKYRDKRALAGYQRLDVYIPPDVWAKLEPMLLEHGRFAGAHELVEFLREITSP